jgi:hypothetical protein
MSGTTIEAAAADALAMRTVVTENAAGLLAAHPLLR